MTRSVIERLQKYSIVPDSAGKAEVVARGKIIIETSQLRRHSVLDLLFLTLQFISWKAWVAQLFLFAASFLLLSRVQEGEKVSSIMQVLTGVLAISVLFFMDELFRSFTSGMWELEETFKYDLRQHTMIKFLIFGLVDMFLILGISLMTSSLIKLPILNTLVYLLVPYNIICIVLFSLVTMWRNYLHRHLMWLLSGLICFFSFVLGNLFHIYQVDVLYWWATYLVTGVILFYLLYLQLQKILSEEVFG